MYALAQSFSFALRQLRKTPGFALTVVLTLALGIGATTAIFSLVEGILLRPLPFRNPDRLFLVGDHIGGGPNTPVTAREIGTYSTATNAFSSLGGFATTDYELSDGVATPQEVRAGRLAASVFPTLGVQPILGRVFTPLEENAHQPLAVLSYALWTSHYHRDPHILGSSIVLDRRPYAIIGVMPRNFEFPLQPGHLNQAQVWVPMSLTPDELSDQHTGFWGYRIIARLKDGVTLPQAAQDADRVARQIMRDFPTNMSKIRIRGDALLLREHTVVGVRSLYKPSSSPSLSSFSSPASTSPASCSSEPSAAAANTLSASPSARVPASSSANPSARACCSALPVVSWVWPLPRPSSAPPCTSCRSPCRA
jgi:hypothetical protein